MQEKQAVLGMIHLFLVPLFLPLRFSSADAIGDILESEGGKIATPQLREELNAIHNFSYALYGVKSMKQLLQLPPVTQVVPLFLEWKSHPFFFFFECWYFCSAPLIRISILFHFVRSNNLNHSRNHSHNHNHSHKNNNSLRCNNYQWELTRLCPLLHQLLLLPLLQLLLLLLLQLLLLLLQNRQPQSFRTTTDLRSLWYNFVSFYIFRSGLQALKKKNGFLPRYDNLYLNTTEPFCAITVGVQGAGKSHTISTIVEACMLV